MKLSPVLWCSIITYCPSKRVKPNPQYGCDAPPQPVTTAGAIVYYLNGLGGRDNIKPRDLDSNPDEYSYMLYVLQEIYGKDNVNHIPLFTDKKYRDSIWAARGQMVAEAFGLDKTETNTALEYILAHPPAPGQPVVIVGSSAGGTVAVELLKLLEDENIFVDTLILRGSFVNEISLTNVGEVHYLAGDPPSSDIYYSVDINPFDGVQVQEHIVPGLNRHAVSENDNPKQALANIGALMVSILRD